MNTRVSLIVVEEPDEFQHKQRNFLASVAAQTCPHEAFELIMVERSAQSAAAATFDAFRARHPMLSISLLRCASTSRAAANNLAAAHAAGEVLVFLADDFDPSPGLLDAHASYHALNPDLDAVGIGPGLFPDELRREAFTRWLEDSGQIFGVPMRGALAFWPRTYFYAGNASIKKAKFDALGGFDERFRYDAWDDYEFGLRWADSGGYSQFIAAAAATHRHAVSFEERCVTMERSGESALVLERLHPRLDHDWRAMLRRGAQAHRPVPAVDAPPHVRLAYYAEQLDAAFLRGYLSAVAEVSPG